ncbi:MAG TPA: DUF99 family protein [Thermoplasmata archaeon]|nr:DUF99 family protein [Thermoplasmata archaeon]
MKAKSRFLGIDDAPFRFGDAEVPVVGVVVQAPAYIEGVLTTHARVDGRDATDRLRDLLSRSRYREGLEMIFVDGAAVGGFNVVDIDALSAAAGVPVVTVTRRRPGLESIRAAMKRKFADWEERWDLIARHGIEEISTRHSTLFVTFVGTDRQDVRQALVLTTVRGALPEPLRVAHLIAAGLVKGESHGRA